jgi:hypothetical protein
LYSNTPPHVQAPPGRIRGILEWAVIILINAPARIRTRDLWLWYHIELHAPTNSTQKLKPIGKVGNSLVLQQMRRRPLRGEWRTPLRRLRGEWTVDASIATTRGAEGRCCRMDLPGPTTSVGTRTDYSMGPWDYSAYATRHLMAWGARTSVEKYSDRKLYMSCTM